MRLERASALADGAVRSLQAALSEEGSNAPEARKPHRPKVTWEPNVWQRLSDGNYASMEQARADIHAARHSLSASIVSAYFILIEANRQKTLLRGHLISRRELENKFKSNNHLAIEGAQPQLVASWNREASEERVALIEDARRKASHSLEALISGFPPVALSNRQSLPTLPPNPPKGVSSGRLERRPDLVVARLELALADPQVDRSAATDFADFDLFEDIGLPSQDLIDIAHAPYSIESTTSDSLRAKTNYEAVAIDAYREVLILSESVLDLAERRAFLEVVTLRSETALEAALNGNELGEQDHQAILIELQNLYQTRTALLSTRRQQLEHYAVLMLCLGGG
ncbi:MAG: hypothetical protein AAF583_00860 [Pseudomonadota bacterium]